MSVGEITATVTSRPDYPYGYTCTLSGNGNEAVLDISLADTPPASVQMFFILLDFNDTVKGLKFGVQGKESYTLYPEVLNDWFPGIRRFNFGITTGAHGGNVLSFCRRDLAHSAIIIKNAAGCGEISRKTTSDTHNWAHTIYRDANTSVPSVPSDYDYSRSWALSGKMPSPPNNDKYIYVAMNNYKQGYSGYRYYRMSVEWFLGPNFSDYGFMADDVGFQGSTINGIKLGMEKKNSTQTTISARVETSSDSTYITEVFDFSNLGYIYFSLPSGIIPSPSLKLYNYQPIDPWGSWASQPGPDLEVLPNSNNPPSGTTSTQVSTVRINPPMSYTAGV